MTHFHIRWIDKTRLDWERFNSQEEAKSRAKELAREGEDYRIEQFDGDCPQCAATLKLATGDKITINTKRIGQQGDGDPLILRN